MDDVWRAVFARPCRRLPFVSIDEGSSALVNARPYQRLCDAVPSMSGQADELRDIAEACCNADGTLRFRDLPGLDRVRDRASSHSRG